MACAISIYGMCYIHAPCIASWFNYHKATSNDCHKSVHFPPFYDNISVDATGTTFLYVYLRDALDFNR